MRFPTSAVILLATTFAIGMPKSQFVGKWQTRISRVTHVEQEQRLGGTVVLVNPDASEIELPILNVRVTDKVIEFETHDNRSAITVKLKIDTFYWSLTVQKHDQALLHGSCGEMLIDERVRRQH